MNFEIPRNSEHGPTELENLRDAISAISNNFAVMEINEDHLIVMAGGIVPDDETKMIEMIEHRGGAVEIIEKNMSEENAPAISYRLKVTLKEHE